MTNQPTNLGTFRIPENAESELYELYDMVERFKAGQISETQFRAFRVPMGIYEQRECGTYMLRLRCPGGLVLPHQLKRMAEVAESFGNGVLHVTTRQAIQVHRVPLDSIFPALVSLLEAKLSTKGGGGNTVRNITACYDSGVCPKEIFDVAPCAVALTERMLTDRLSFELPRKYKIAFSACSDDCAGGTVHDLGFVARRQNGTEGFAVYVGGGLGGKSRVANLLHAFVPVSDVFLVAEAIKRVFDKNGDRKNKHKARLRFLVERIGLDAFRELYEQELCALRVSGPKPFEPRSTVVARERKANVNGVKTSAEYRHWVQHNVLPQKQEGFFMVEIPLALGDLPGATAMKLAAVIESHGEQLVCATPAQNLVLRWVSEGELPALYEKLQALGLADAQAPVLRHLVACAGASTCRLGICLSRGLAKAVYTWLRVDSLDLDKLGDLRIHVSGCPNSCGRHPVADIGFSGAARRMGERLVPYYTVHLGGRIAEGKTRLGVPSGTIPAHHVPAFLAEFLKKFLESGHAPDFHGFVDNGGRAMAEELVARYQTVPPYETDRTFYFDWDADTLFSLAGRGAGECSAGVFDLIEVDLAAARKALESGRHYAATALAARSLLITRGAQPKADAEAFELFHKHFISEGLVNRRFEVAIATGIRSAGSSNPEQNFGVGPAETGDLLTAVESLYAGMDASLRFKPAAAVTK